ncbi:hypothetical protein WN51_05522 [Melipona quadrifasciata]|uniref:Uncharacterized protein n=1 Tax=Melipona quadrifasciata TaxID=166423 RepID=A0A0N0U3N0_9HYME|nr:hypothetical protein WN51_05522 [Melipona quadrifasciata]
MGGALALGIALWRMSYLQGSRFNDATLMRPKGLFLDFDPIPVAYSRRLLFDAMILCNELGRMPSGTEEEESKLKQFWKEGTMRLPERWKKVIEQNGSYIT